MSMRIQKVIPFELWWKIMRIEITFQNQTDTIELPSDIDLVGISLNNPKNVLNVSQGFPEMLGGAPVECNTEQKRLADGYRQYLLLIFINLVEKQRSFL